MSFTTECLQNLDTGEAFTPPWETETKQPTPVAKKELPPSKISKVFGLPPDITDTDPNWIKRFRVLELTPGILELVSSIWKYDFRPQWDTYQKRLSNLLKNLGIGSSQVPQPLRFAVDVEDIELSQGNQYEPNIFAKTIDWAGSMTRQLAQVGAQNASGILNTLFNSIKTQITELGSIDSTLINSIVGRVNLPLMWEESTTSQEYSFNIKLVAKAEAESVKQQMLIPLAVLLALTCPVVLAGGIAYGSPLFIRARVRGGIYISAGVISMKVDKPNTWIYQGNKLWGVKVALTLKSVYPVMMREKVPNNAIPSVPDYIQTLHSSWKE